MAKEKAKFNLSSITEKLQKINPFISKISETQVAIIPEWIHTGNYMMNAVLSGSLLKGLPSNKSVCFGGNSGVGKTFMCLNVAKNVQEMGYEVYYIDTEGAIDKDTVERFKIDMDKFYHIPCSDLVKLKEIVTNITHPLMEAKAEGKELPKVAIFLDSLGMLASSKELADALSGNDKRDMTKAQMVRSFFRLTTSDLTALGIPFIITNHIVTDVGSMFPQFTMSGGMGVVYATSIIIELTKAKLKDDKEDGKQQTGIIVTVKAQKNRFARPKDCKIHLHFKKGMNPYVGLHEFISWEACGIQKGNIFTAKDYMKMSEKDKSLAKPFEKDGQTFYFYPKESARNFVVKHLGDYVHINDLFTERVFPREILQQLDDNVIKPLFSYSSGDADFPLFDESYDESSDAENNQQEIEE